jgi:hypothetical protein
MAIHFAATGRVSAAKKRCNSSNYPGGPSVSLAHLRPSVHASQLSRSGKTEKYGGANYFGNVDHLNHEELSMQAVVVTGSSAGNATAEDAPQICSIYNHYVAGC